MYVRFGGKFSETWRGDMPRRTVLTLQGVQYAAQEYVSCLERLGTQISMAAVGQPTENPYAERVIRTIKEEEVYLADYESFADAYHRIGHFIEDVYQTKRIHSALGYLTPAEFESAYWDRERGSP